MGKDVVFFEMILHLSVCRPSRILTVTRIIQTNLLYMIEKKQESMMKSDLSCFRKYMHISQLYSLFF